VSVAVTSLWIASFILTYTFPLMNRGLGAAKTFWIYAGICVAGFIFIKARLPETKGKTLKKSRARGNESSMKWDYSALHDLDCNAPQRARHGLFLFS
jgi:hypothetical protein